MQVAYSTTAPRVLISHYGQTHTFFYIYFRTKLSAGLQ